MKKILSLILTTLMLSNLFAISACASENDSELRSKILDKCGILSLDFEPGDFNPYTDESLERAKKLSEDYSALACNINSTTEELQQAYDHLNDVGSYMYISDSYATATYILALEETNDNGWYNENDWNNFTQSREALRLALNKGNEKLINDTYRKLYDSFTVMTSRYCIASDLNKDGNVSINDVTLILRHNAEVIKLNSAQIMLAQCYTDNINNFSSYTYEKLNVSSATKLQRLLAETENYKLNNEPNAFDQFVYTNSFGDKFNYMIFLRFPDERGFWIDQKINQLKTEGLLP